MENNFVLLLATLLVALCCSESALGEIYFKNGSPHVKLSSRADVSGKTLFSRQGRPYLEFLNIPYATVPERFAASELISEPTWEGVRNGSTNGPMCPQVEAFAEPEALGDEDGCLHMGVYVPLSTTPNKKLAVMVYVHGGGFGLGAGDQIKGKFFVDEEIILVNFNYRVSVYGFLSTQDSVVPGNNGLKDQVTALKWVQKNIHRFGGDPSKVSIFGISAGGAAVHYLYLSQMTKGLFHNAISQSGSALSFWAVDEKPREKAVKLANYLNCDTSASNPEDISSEEILSCLRNVPRDKLTMAANEFIPGYIPSNFGGIFNFGPVAEKNSPAPFLTESPLTLFENSKYPHPEIPLLIGVCKDEGATLSGGAAMKGLGNDLNTRWEEVGPAALLLDRFLTPEDQIVVGNKIRKFYFQDKPISKETRLSLYNAYSDAWALFGVKKAAMTTAARGKNPVYLYLYSYLANSPSPMGDYFGVDAADKLIVHGADIAAMTDFSGLSELLHLPPEAVKAYEDDDIFSGHYVRVLATFAKTGKPEHSWGNSKDKEWLPISKEEGEGKKPLTWYNIDVNPGHIREPFTERMKFWESLWKEHFLAGTKKLKNSKTEL